MDHRSSCRSAEIAPNQSELRWAIAELVAMMLMLMLMMMMAKVTWTFRYMGENLKIMKLLEQVKLVKLPCLFVEFADCVLHFFTLLYVLHILLAFLSVP